MLRRLTILSLLVLGSCIAELAPVDELPTDLDRYAQNTTPLDTAQQDLMEGVYRVTDGAELLGPLVSGRWVDDRWCLFAQHDVVLAELAGGFAGDSIRVTGVIRVVRSGRGTPLDLTIHPDDGGRDLQEQRPPGTVILRGATASGTRITLHRQRDVFQPLAPFHVLAHRGGGRNSERLGMSENSIPMVRYAARFGATGIEIDVKQTRDGHVIVFHDDTFSPRTVLGAYLLGRVDAFDLDQIQRYGRLVNGEQIPTLTEMLRVIVDSTTLGLVWVDVKDAASVPAVIAAQRDAIDHAAANGRSVTIALGIPTAAVHNAFVSAAGTDPPPSISELDLSSTLNNATATNCVAWAPRWTLSISNGDIDRCHAAGLAVFAWTLDVRDYIAEYLYDTPVDGILTNYPSLVAGMQDTRSTP